jgi:ubiquinone/menaquinone biosynthesis C-methylase UbiE
MNGLKAAKKIDQQREHYATIAREFDQKYNRENSNHYYKIEQIEKAFERFLTPSATGWDLMEVGAGSGIHAQHVLERFGDRIRSFVLADLSAEMLERAKARMGDSPKIAYVVSPAEEIAIDRNFDGIYVSGSMHHFSDYRRSIVAARNQLKSDGVLVICEPNVWNPVNLVKAVKDYSLEVGQFSVTRHNITQTLSEEGFEVLSSRVLHFRAGNKLAKTLYPYERLGKAGWLDFLSVMFLVVGKVKGKRAG